MNIHPALRAAPGKNEAVAFPAAISHHVAMILPKRMPMPSAIHPCARLGILILVACCVWPVPATWAAAAGVTVEDDATTASEPLSPVDAYFEAAARPGGGADAAALGIAVVRDHAADALVLDTLAWGILTDETLLHRDLPLALRAARLAHQVTGGTDVEVAETLARALVMTGSRDDGIAMHRRAIDLCGDDPSTRLVLREILAEYLQPPADPGPTDGAVIRRIEAEAGGLIASGRAVAVSRLLDDADVSPCRLEPVAAAAAPLTSEQLFEKVRRSVVVMAALEPAAEPGRYEVTLATGFVIHASGVVATNFHVVDAPESPVLVAMTADGVVYPVTKLLAVSPFADLAICQLDGAEALPPLACVSGARPGQRIHALSHPDGGLYTLTDGILSRYFVHRADGQAKTMFTTTADFAVGSSGGPLVDDRGNVVGMVSSTLAVYAQDAEAAGRRLHERLDDSGDEPAGDEATAVSDGPLLPGDFQMGLNMCVPAADILRLIGGEASAGQ